MFRLQLSFHDDTIATMTRVEVETGRVCPIDGKPIRTVTPNNVNQKIYCSDQCRRQGWEEGRALEIWRNRRKR